MEIRVYMLSLGLLIYLSVIFADLCNYLLVGGCHSRVEN